jgi:Sec-independent protein translocase protein TatA
MEFLGVGPVELAFVLLIALILLGPKDMIEAGRTLGKTLRKVVTSPTWKALRTTGQELQKLPTRLIREAGLDEFKDMEQELRDAAHISIDPRLVSREVPDEPPAESPEPATPSVILPTPEPQGPQDDEPKPPSEDLQDTQ